MLQKYPPPASLRMALHRPWRPWTIHPGISAPLSRHSPKGSRCMVHRICVAGASGRMGRMLIEAISAATTVRWRARWIHCHPARASARTPVPRAGADPGCHHRRL